MEKYFILCLLPLKFSLLDNVKPELKFLCFVFKTIYFLKEDTNLFF